MWSAKNGRVTLGHTDMAYVSFGYGDKPLIFLPGLSDGLATVKGKALLLAKPYKIFFEKYKVYIFSRKNDLPVDYTIRDMAKDQAEALGKLGMKKAAVLGVSQGGMIAQYLAIDHAELIEKLVIAVSAPRANEIIQKAVKKWISLANQGKHKQLMIDVTEKSYSQEYLKKYRKLYPIIGFVARPSSYKRFLINAKAILSFNALDDLKSIRCPTLIIAGDADKIVGIEASYEMHEHIGESKLHVYSGLGHSAFEEAKDFNKRVLDFLEMTQ